MDLSVSQSVTNAGSLLQYRRNEFDTFPLSIVSNERVLLQTPPLRPAHPILGDILHEALG